MLATKPDYRFTCKACNRQFYNARLAINCHACIKPTVRASNQADMKVGNVFLLKPNHYFCTSVKFNEKWVHHRDINQAVHLYYVLTRIEPIKNYNKYSTGRTTCRTYIFRTKAIENHHTISTRTMYADPVFLKVQIVDSPPDEISKEKDSLLCKL